MSDRFQTDHRQRFVGDGNPRREGTDHASNVDPASRTVTAGGDVLVVEDPETSSDLPTDQLRDTNVN